MIKKSKPISSKTVKPIIKNKMSKAVKKQIETLNKEGNILLESANYSEALEKFDENINIINKIKIYDEYYLISLINKASVLISLTRYDESIALNKKIQKLSTIAPKRKDLTDLDCTFGLALANNWLKNNDLAIKYYIKALELTKDDKISKYYKEKIYDHLSSLYYRVKKFPEALKY
jgi:tetratricopeptide (TPR) repeat protein